MFFYEKENFMCFVIGSGIYGNIRLSAVLETNVVGQPG